MVRTWSYLNKPNFLNDIRLYREFQKRPTYKIFKATTKLRRANLPRYLRILNRTWFPRRRYSRRRRQTTWAPLRFLPIAWARLYISEKSLIRFYQSLNTLPFTSLGADPLVLVKRTSKIGKDCALSSFASTKRVTQRFLGQPNLMQSVFLFPRGNALTNGISAADSDSLIKGTLAAPWGLVYDNLVFSYNTSFPSVYYSNPLQIIFTSDLVLSYVTFLYRLIILITLYNLA